MTTSIFFLIILIVAALIIVCIYYFIYKKNLNKALDQNNGKHVSMPSISSIVLSMAIVVMLICYIGISSGIKNLTFQISGIEDSINENNENNQSILNDMQEQLKKDTSLITSFDCSYGKFDSTTNTGEIIFNVIPKEYDDKTEILLNIGNQTVELKNQQNGQFEGSIKANIFDSVISDDSEIPFLTIKDGSTIKTEKLADDNDIYDAADPLYSPLYYEFIPSLDSNGCGSEINHNGKKTKINIDIDLSPTETDNVKFTDCCLKIDVNDINEYQEKVDLNDVINTGTLNVKKTVQANKNDIIKVYLVANDSAGYTHNLNVIEIKNNGSTDLLLEEIYDKNGKLLTSE